MNQHTTSSPTVVNMAENKASSTTTAASKTKRSKLSHSMATVIILRFLCVNASVSFSDLAEILDRLHARYKSADLLNPLNISKVIDAEFDEREQELLYTNILLTNTPLNMPQPLKHRVHIAIQKLKNRRKMLRSHKTCATTDTARFCKIFYRTPSGIHLSVHDHMTLCGGQVL